MSPDDVKQYYGSGYRFNKETGMSHSTLSNWVKWGYVPLVAQTKLQLLTKGLLKAEWPELKESNR